MQKYTYIILLLFIGIFITTIIYSVEAAPVTSPDYSTAYEVINLVNLLRAERGLPPYTPNSILMSIAQTQAEYVASIGVSTTHIDAYGRRPFQRALDAGYPVAGDLSLGGFFSENVVGNVGLSAEGAVEWWMGDAEHQNTMLSSNLQDVGAGVAIVVNTYYYVLDAGLSTGGTPRPYTQPPYIVIATPTIATNTPDNDGAIYYIVQPGDSLLKIAIAYNITLNDLYVLNGLNERSTIYPEQKIIIRSAYTTTPTSPTGTPTGRPSSTPWPTSSLSILTTSPALTKTVIEVETSIPAGGAVIAIIIAAIIAAAFLTITGARRNTVK